MPDSAPPRLLDAVRGAIRVPHYSLRTERAYQHWIRRFVLFNQCRHPSEMGAAEVAAFLSHLANEGGVAAATQNRALAALLFLYKAVLGIELPWLEEVVRVRGPKRIPAVLSGTKCRRCWGR